MREIGGNSVGNSLGPNRRRPRSSELCRQPTLMGFRRNWCVRVDKTRRNDGPICVEPENSLFAPAPSRAASDGSDSRCGSPTSLLFQGAAHASWVIESVPSDRQAVSGGSGSPEPSLLAATPGAG
jgi:hypothetical protein